MKKLRNFILLMLCTLLTGCSFNNDSSISSIVNDSKEQSKSSYYMELETCLYKNGTLNYIDKEKRWYDSKGKRVRYESEETDDKGEVNNLFYTYDGKDKSVFYNKTKNEAMIFNKKDLPSFGNFDLKSEALDSLNIYRETHKISMGKEELINGFKTYKVHMEPKDKTNDSAYDLWIDALSLAIVKSESSIFTSDNKYEFKRILKKLDLSPNISSDLFSLSLPKDVKIEKESDYINYNDTTLENASKKIGSPLLYYKGTGTVKLKKVRLMSSSKEDNSVLIDLDYCKNNIPCFEINISKAGMDTSNIKYAENKIIIRGISAEVISNDDTKSIQWNENGLHYVLHSIDPAISLNNLKNIAEGLTYSNNK